MQPIKIGGDSGYSLTNVTYVYIHGRGGYFDAPVALTDYEFDIQTPPRPAGFVGAPGWWLLETPYGGPQPQVVSSPSATCAGSPASPCSFRVKYPLPLGDPSPDRRFAALIATGWRTPAGVGFRTLRVHFENVTILKRHNILCLADWKMWLNVNGQWINVDGMAGVNEGTIVDVNRDVFVTVPDSPSSVINVEATGWVSFWDAGFGENNDRLRLIAAILKGTQFISKATENTAGRIGLFFQRYDGTQNFGVGNHSITSSRFQEIDNSQDNSDAQEQASRTDGDFRIKYSIQPVP